MKRCPTCNRVETDEALSFCRADGTPLVSDSLSRDTEAGTVKFGTAPTEVETTILSHQTDIQVNRATGPTTVLPPQQLPAATQQLSKSKQRKAVIVFAASAVVLTILICGYFFTRSSFVSVNHKSIESVAVLPFENKSGNADSEYLSDGLAESLIYRLSQLSNLKVTPRSSAFRYKGKDVDAEKIGSELGVDAVMSGRLVQRGDDLVISVDLIDVRNKKTLWGEQFQRKMSDLLATQSDIAAAIADKLQLRLSGNDSTGINKQYTNSNEAYQLYLQGRYFWNKRSSNNLRRASELFSAATQKDPSFALAYSGLADCYAVSYYYVGERPRELMPLAKTYAAKAIELDPTLAEPHATLGFETA